LNWRREKDARWIMVVARIQVSTSNRLASCGGETRKRPRMLPASSGTLFYRAQTEVGEKMTVGAQASAVAGGLASSGASRCGCRNERVAGPARWASRAPRQEWGGSGHSVGPVRRARPWLLGQRGRASEQLLVRVQGSGWPRPVYRPRLKWPFSDSSLTPKAFLFRFCHFYSMLKAGLSKYSNLNLNRIQGILSGQG
jgi:hypothetical protein